MSISDAKYVSITTFRKSGAAVPSPVWIAPLPDGRAGFTTGATSGKVKRLKNDPAVTLRPCNMRGAVEEGADEVAGTAVVVYGAEADAVEDAIVRKYGLMARMMVAGSAVKAKIATIRKRPVEESCAVIVTFE